MSVLGVPPCPVHTKRAQAGCLDCRRYRNAYERRKYREIAYGRWEGVLTGEQIEPTLAHLRGLLAESDISVPRIARAAGVNHMAIYRLLSGQTVQLRPALSRAVLALTAEQVRCHSLPSLVDSTGLARRLRALAVEQWGSPQIAALIPYSVASINHWRQQNLATVRREAHDAVAALYEKILGLPDPLGPSVQARRQALRRGYLGPERWDDATIDDPDAHPLPLLPEVPDPVELRLQIQEVLRLRTPGAGSGWPREVKRRMAQLAYQDGWLLADVAAVLGMSKSAVEYLLHGRRDRPHTRR